MRAAEDTLRSPLRVLACLHSLAEIVERRAGVQDERLRVKHAHPERGVIAIDNAPRHGQHFAQQ